MQTIRPLKLLVSQLNEGIFKNFISPYSEKKKLVWLASYPKSGSNYVRSIFTSLYSPGKIMNVFMPDMHEFGMKKSLQMVDPVNLDDENLYFLKTHQVTLPESEYLLLRMVNHGFIYIYRHPLDVFLSSLNHLYITENRKGFFDGDMKSVDQLRESGDLGKYTRQFIENMEIGNNAFSEMCGGTWLNHVTSWLDLHKQGSGGLSAIIKYEDLLLDPFSALRPLIYFLGKTDDDLQSALDLAARKTKKDGKFYWKQKAGNYSDYLSKDEISEFTTKYQGSLQQLGYL